MSLEYSASPKSSFTSSGLDSLISAIHPSLNADELIKLENSSLRRKSEWIRFTGCQDRT